LRSDLCVSVGGVIIMATPPRKLPIARDPTAAPGRHGIQGRTIRPRVTFGKETAFHRRPFSGSARLGDTAEDMPRTPVLTTHLEFVASLSVVESWRSLGEIELLFSP